MANKEFDQSDLQSAAKALGCEDCLPKNNCLPHSLPSLKDPSHYDHYVQDAMRGSVSFSPDERTPNKVSYADSLRVLSRHGRSLNKWCNATSNSARNMMLKKPGLDRD